MLPRIPLRPSQALRPVRIASPWGTKELKFSSFLVNRTSSAGFNSPQFSKQSRFLSCTAPVLKKKDKASKASKSASSSSTESSDPEAAADDSNPFDFSTLEQGIEKSLEKLKNDLGKLRTGGRFNPEVLESLRVKLVKDSNESFKLGDLAQVLPKGGRSIQVLVGEKDHVKHITSAIQASPNLQLTPQPDTHNPLALNIPIPPPTKESRDAAIQAASKAGEQATAGVRNSRAASQKRLRAMELKKLVRPDDLKKAHKEMEMVVEKGNKKVKEEVEKAKKDMEQ